MNAPAGLVVLLSLLGPAQPAPAPVPLAADQATSTVAGNPFIAPVGWTIEVRGPATILSPPEPGSHMALIDVQAKDADAAVALAWQAYKPDHAWPLLVANDQPDRDGWSRIRGYSYQTSPNEKRTVSASARFAGGSWTVVIVDMGQDVVEKRGAQLALIGGRLLPKGYQRESFAGRRARVLDSARVAELAKFVESAGAQLGVPGVSFGLVQDGKVVYAGGVGVRELGGGAKVDADTLYMIASNTKALTTLLLAKLVDANRLSWDTPVTSLLPTFKLGDPETTRQVLVRHLICACTGLPRQDLEWLFQFQGVTPAGTMAMLATVQPTTKFGEMFQYSNLLAAAAGFVGGHVAYPDLELGAAYDQAMQTLVFDPLGMQATTFDYARALRGNHAMPYAPDIDGRTAPALMEINYAAIPTRPAGAAWSNVRDLLKYVQMELAEGKLADGSTYIAKAPLLERRVPQVPVGKDVTYGMGLQVERTYGVPVVHHGGDLIGFHSDMLWLPEHGVGAVVLTNGELGSLIAGQFGRKLLEVLFDGNPEADARIAAAAKSISASRAARRKLMTVPADAADSAKLASHYFNGALGDITVVREGGKTIFDFGEFRSEVASRHNPDGTVSFLTAAPGFDGFELLVGAGPQRTLLVHDAQHEYVFAEK